MSGSNEKKRKLIKNTLWFFCGTFFPKVITFFLVPFYTSILTAAEYSISDVLSTTVTLLLPFFSLVISNAVCRFSIDKIEERKQIHTFGLTVVLIGFIPLVGLSFCIFKFIPGLQIYWGYFISIYILSAISTLESEFLKGVGEVKLLAIANGVQAFVFVISNIVFLRFLDFRIKGYLLSFITSYLSSILIYLVFGRIWTTVTSPLTLKKSLCQDMVRYSIPLVPNSAMWWITNSSDRYFVTLMVSVAANGLLSVSYKIPSMLSVFIGIFHSAWELSVVEDFENEKGKAFFCSVYQKYICCNVLICSFLIIISKILGKLLYSNDFFEAWKYSAVLIVGNSFHTISSFLGYIFTTVKKTNKIFNSTLIGAVLNLVLNYFLIKCFGILGALIATDISYFVIFVIRRFGTKKYINIKIDEEKGVISFCLLIVETIFVYMDSLVWWSLATLLFIIVVLINFRFIKDLLTKARKLIRSFFFQGKVFE